jgi:hypothetical protein
MQTDLHGAHRRTFDAIFQHPVSRNLHWRDVRSLLNALAEVVDEPNGNVKVSRGGQTLVIHPSRDKDVAEVAELMEIRHFLQRSGAAAPEPEAAAGAAGAAGAGAHLLVVIDHREARIYQADVHGSVPQRITPYDPHGFGRYLHYVQDDSNGQRKPERKSFYESVAKTLQGAQRILLFGSGTGSSSAMDQLLAELKRRHRQTAERIDGSFVVDEQHLTENQLLAKAREFYAKIESPGATPSPVAPEGSAPR